MRKQLRKFTQILDGTATDYGEKQRGQSLLELAFFMPILIIMLVGLAEIGWFTNNYLIMLEVSRVAARFGTVLTGNNDPIAWDAGEVTYQGTDNLGNSVVFRVRTVEGTIPSDDWRSPTVPVEDQSDVAKSLRDCANAEGFYEAISCLAIDSMAPLEMEVDADLDNRADGIQDNFNDIVISVFSTNVIPDPRTLAGQAKTNVESIQDRPFSSAEQDEDFRNNAPRDDSGNPDTNAPQIMVTGRYPASANECSEAGVADHRDPFDINSNGNFDDFEIDASRERIRDSAQTNTWPLLDDGADGQRGFAYTGRWRVRDSNGNLTGCYGSQFTIAQIERIINLRGIGLDAEEMNQLPDSQAFALVEVMWQHQLLLNFPGFDLLPAVLSADGEAAYIQVWAAFPVPAAEFNMNLDQ